MTKIQVRKGLFETNSSSVHSIVMCSDSDFEKWKNGESIYSREYECLVSIEDKDYLEWKKLSDEEKLEEWSMYDYLTYDQFFYDDEAIQHETFITSYDTPKGETVVAFGYYGHN